MLATNLTSKHFEAFGIITASYASIETGFKYAICGMLDIFPYEAMAICEPYNSLALRNVVKALAKQNLDESKSNKLIQLVGEFGSHSKLRNYIAHNDWANGARPTSIKPVQMNIREGRLDTKGFAEDEKDYTLDELLDSAKQLVSLRDKVVRYLHDSGMADAIEQKMDEHNFPKDASDEIV